MRFVIFTRNPESKQHAPSRRVALIFTYKTQRDNTSMQHWMRGYPQLGPVDSGPKKEVISPIFFKNAPEKLASHPKLEICREFFKGNTPENWNEISYIYKKYNKKNLLVEIKIWVYFHFFGPKSTEPNY